MASFVSAPLPALDLDSNATLTVDTQDPLAIVTQVVVHLTQDVPETAITPEPVPPILAYVPQP